MDTGVIIPETENTYTVYWTKLPEALRDVIGDPLGRPPRSVEEFRQAVENYLLVPYIDGSGNMDPDLIPPAVDWGDEDSAAVAGYIQLDDGGAEDMASSLAVELEAFQILQFDDSTYVVCGMQLMPDEGKGCGSFDWQLVIGDAEEHLSDDAARWRGQVAQ
jgi:hypothetical protein